MLLLSAHFVLLPIRRAGAEKSGKERERGKMGFASLILPVREPPFVFCDNEFDCLLKGPLIF